MIVCLPSKILTTRAKKVKKIDKKVSRVIEKLKKDLIEKEKPKGVGLAAPQIGVSLRIFITKPTADSKIRAFINPQVVWKSKDVEEIKRPKKERRAKADPLARKKLEGCLSIPNIWGYLKRYKKVRLKYMDEEGKEKEEEFSGFLATIIQHEIDHLDGILFTQRVIEQGEKLYKLKKDTDGKEKLVGIKI